MNFKGILDIVTHIYWTMLELHQVIAGVFEWSLVLMASYEVPFLKAEYNHMLKMLCLLQCFTDIVSKRLHYHKRLMGNAFRKFKHIALFSLKLIFSQLNGWI